MFFLSVSQAGKDQFFELTVGGTDESHQKTLFDQPTDRMMSMVQSATNLAMEFPDRYGELYMCLTWWQDSSPWKSHVEWRCKGEKGTPPVDPQDAIRDRTRMNHLVARKLDTVQTKLTYYWERWVQGVAFALSFAVLWHLMSHQEAGAVQWPVVLLGSVMAPFAKDVVTGLASFRKR